MGSLFSAPGCARSPKLGSGSWASLLPRAKVAGTLRKGAQPVSSLPGTSLLAGPQKTIRPPQPRVGSETQRRNREGEPPLTRFGPASPSSGPAPMPSATDLTKPEPWPPLRPPPASPGDSKNCGGGSSLRLGSGAYTRCCFLRESRERARPGRVSGSAGPGRGNPASGALGPIARGPTPSESHECSS